MTDSVEIEVEILQRSASTVLITDARVEVRLPKSQITIEAVPSQDGHEYARITLQVWLATKRGLV